MKWLKWLMFVVLIGLLISFFTVAVSQDKGMTEKARPLEALNFPPLPKPAAISVPWKDKDSSMLNFDQLMSKIWLFSQILETNKELKCWLVIRAGFDKEGKRELVGAGWEKHWHPRFPQEIKGYREPEAVTLTRKLASYLQSRGERFDNPKQFRYDLLANIW